MNTSAKIKKITSAHFDKEQCSKTKSYIIICFHTKNNKRIYHLIIIIAIGIQCTYTLSHIQTYMHTYLYMYMHIHIHMYTYI